MNKYLRKKLEDNGVGNLASDLNNISPEDSAKVALGVQLIFENFNCEPNGGIIFDIIDYLNYKSTKHQEEMQWKEK